nr:YafY family protein [Pseudomonas brassicacearum subsp. brassicacearum]
MSRTSRLLTLLQVLRGKRCPVTAATLAGELNVSERTLYRDIAELTALGAPIQGEAGIGYVLRSGLFLPPLMFTADEIEAIVLGLRYVDQRADEVLGKAAADALAKVAAVLAPRCARRLAQPHGIARSTGLWLSAEHGGTECVPPGHSRPGQAAYRLRRCEQDPEPTLDLAAGPGLFFNEARVVVAWCELRGAYRTFSH